MRYFPTYIHVLLVLVFVWVTPARAQVRISGTLFGTSGEPMPTAHVAVEAGPLDTTLIAAANTEGQFSVNLPGAGVYGIYLMGPHHETLEIPLIVRQPDSVDLHVRLGTAEYGIRPDSLWLATASSGYKKEEAVLMRPEGSVYTASVSADTDTLAYQIRGFSRSAERIGGTSADRWAFNSEGPFWDDESEYISVLTGLTRDSIRVTFDPHALPPSGLKARVRSRDSTVEGIAEIYLQTEAMERELGRKARSLRSLYNSVQTDQERKVLRDSIRQVMDRFADSLSAPITERIEREENPILRRWLMLRYFDELTPSAEDSVLAQRTLREVPSTSSFWSYEAWSRTGASNLITGITEYAQDPDLIGSYFDAVIDNHPDPDVRRHFLYAGIYWADQAGKEKRRLTYQGQLMGEFAESWHAERVRREYGPEREIQVGQSIPDFSLQALRDSSLVYTDESMEGQVYLIDVWAVWCGPCIAEMDELHTAYEKYQDEGFEILSISLDETRSDVQVFRENRWPMPWKHHFAGFSGQGRKQVEETFEVTGVPRTILVDENGEIVATGEALRGSRLDSTLSAVMGAP